MIQHIRFRNFKCFDGLDLELEPLTLFTGFNASGKSTTIQTLLLLEQTLRGPLLYPWLMLNGPILNLGAASDVLNANSGLKNLSIGVRCGEEALVWDFFLSEERLLTVDRLAVFDERKLEFDGEDLIGIRPPAGDGESVISALESIIYLGAARQVDTEVYPSAFGAGLPKGDVGPIGQFAGWWLHELGEEEAPETRRHVDGSGRASIRQHVNSWIGDLFPGGEANSIPVERTNLMRLQLRSGPTSDWVRPANIGYGISYAFPIIVAGMCARDRQTVIIDSPEAHLHPRAQSRVGRFISQMAGAGVQMLVETHSDHVVNGVRLAIRDGLIRPEQVAIYFFGAKPNSSVIRLSVDKNGTVSDIPGGFFDQAERDLGNLAGWDL